MTHKSSIGKSKSAAGAALRVAADVSGAAAIARVVVEASDEIVDHIVSLARKRGVSEAKIRAALKLRRKAERVQSLAALVMPGLPNPALLRYVANRPEREPQ